MNPNPPSPSAVSPAPPAGRPARIALIEPRATNLHIFSMFPLPRLGTLILGTILRERGCEVDVYVEEFRQLDFEALARADVVGISTITATAPRAYAIADRVRELGRPVLMGGPHVTFLPDEGLEHADYVLRGEAEGSLPAFVDALRAGSGFESVPGLSWRRDGAAVHNPAAPPVADLDALPFTDFGLLRPDRPARGRVRTVPVQTSRGCPFHCSFCSVTGMFGKAYRFRSVDHVVRELRRYDDRRTSVFFYDDNFAANREHTKELLRAMIRERFRFTWTTQVRADVARDPELVRLMKKAGCRTVYIGFESVNPKTLAASHKAQTVAELARAVRVLRRARIHIHGMFVFGFDQDDRDTVRATVKWAKRSRLTSTQFLILTPLPGSEFYDQVSAERRIAFRDWSLYDAHHAVFKPARLTLPDLQMAQIRAHKAFYSAKEQVKKLLEGRWMALGIAGYARNLNRAWKKRNKTFLKAVKLLRPRRNVEVTVDYRETVRL